MQTDDELKNELKEISFGVFDIQTVSAPEGYFEKLPDLVLERWKNEEGKAMPRAISIRRMITTAAVITGIFFGVTWWTNQSALGQATDEISSEDAYQYIKEHMEDFAPMMLESGPLAEELTKTMPPLPELEEYLLEEMEDEDFENIF